MRVLKAIYGRLSKTWADIQADRIGDWAAALTYFSMLSLFPSLIVVVALIGVIGDSAIDSLLDNLGTFSPSAVRDIVTQAIEGVRGNTTAGAVLVVSLAAALWSASGYIGAFSRAAGAIWRDEPQRRFYEAIPIKLGITALMLVLLGLIAMVVVFSGTLATELGRLLGVGDGVLQAWSVLKWPVVLVLMMMVLSLLYITAPDIVERRYRLITRGGAIAVAIWAAASYAFSLYVSLFANYNKVYGSLGGVIVFLIWLWISNLAVLLGVQIDAKRANRARPEL